MLPKELEVQYNQTLAQIEKEKKVQYTQYISTPERVQRWKFEEGLKKGLHEGEAAMLMRLLQRRFREIPSHYLELIQQADTETLLVWAERVLEADSLEEIFG